MTRGKARKVNYTPNTVNPWLASVLRKKEGSLSIQGDPICFFEELDLSKLFSGEAYSKVAELFVEAAPRMRNLKTLRYVVYLVSRIFLIATY